MSKKQLLVMLMVVFVFSLPTVFGVLVVDGEGSTDIVIGQASESQLTKTTQAQNVTITNIVTEIETTHWSAFLGNVTASLSLTGGQSQGIFEFNMNGSNVDSIGASTDPNFDWGNYQAVSASDVDLLLNISTSAADSASQAFEIDGEGTLSILLRNTTAEDFNWGVSIVSDTGSIAYEDHLDQLAFIGFLNDGQQIENYMGGTSEYQMIVGVNETETPGLDVEVSYYFWLLEAGQ